MSKVKGYVFHNNVISERMLCVDIETTGLEADKGSVVEITMTEFHMSLKPAIGYLQPQVDRKYHAMFSPVDPKHLEGAGMSVNRIDPSELACRARFPESREAEHLRRYLENYVSKGKMVLLAHYAPFELQWLMHHLYDGQGDFTDQLMIYDTRDVETVLYPQEGHSLRPTAERYGCLVQERHRSDGDVRMTIDVMRHQVETILSHGMAEPLTREYRYDIDMHKERI